MNLHTVYIVARWHDAYEGEDCENAVVFPSLESAQKYIDALLPGLGAIDAEAVRRGYMGWRIYEKAIRLDE